jgi:hypothetical protein
MPDATFLGATFFPEEYEFARGKSSIQARAAFSLSRLRRLRELMLTLNGEAAGGAALSQYSRVEAANSDNIAGVRTIETVSLVDRATVAADETEIDANVLDYSLHNASPPADLNGNPLGHPGLI